jgi:hypothetical protein
VTEFDQYRARRVFGEPARDDHGAKLVVKATVFSFGHDANPSPPTMRAPHREVGVPPAV